MLSSTVQQEVNERLLEEVNDDATVVVEGTTVETARQLYDAGAHYVIMSTHLSADRVAEQLRAVLRGERRFSDADPETLPSNSEPETDGGTDDV